MYQQTYRLMVQSKPLALPNILTISLFKAAKQRPIIAPKRISLEYQTLSFKLKATSADHLSKINE